MNNFEKIKQMNVDEMAEMLNFITAYGGCECCTFKHNKEAFCTGDCEKGIKQWLLQEVEND